MIQGVVELFKEKYFKGQEEKMVNFFANWERSKAKKSKLIEMLGGEEKVIEIKITEETIAQMFPYTFDVIRAVCSNAGEQVTTEQIIANRTASGRKLSRFLIANRDKLRIQRYLPNMTVRREIGFDGYGIDTFMKCFYEKIAGLKSESLVISANYIDILSCGNVSGENSCYTQSIFRSDVFNHGQYSAAPHVMAEDENTLIAYVLHPSGTKFLKRIFVHVNDERDRFILGRPYGNFGNYAMTALYRELESLCGDPDPSNWTFRQDRDSYLSRGNRYVRYNHDEDNLFYTGDTAAYIFKNRNAKTDSLLIKNRWDIKCIACGCGTDHIDGSGMCYECTDAIERGSKCSYCGDRHRGLVEFRDGFYCQQCAGRVDGLEAVCPDCGDTFTEAFQYCAAVRDYVCSGCHTRRTEERRARLEAERATHEVRWHESMVITPETVLEYARRMPTGLTGCWSDEASHIEDAIRQRYAATEALRPARATRPQEEIVYAFPSRIDAGFMFGPEEAPERFEDTVTTMTSRDFQEYVGRLMQQNIERFEMGEVVANIQARDLTNFDLAEMRI